MIGVIIHKGTKELWDGDLHALPQIGHNIRLVEGGKSKEYTVDRIVHRIDDDCRPDDRHVVYIRIK